MTFDFVRHVRTYTKDVRENRAHREDIALLLLECADTIERLQDSERALKRGLPDAG